MTLLNILLRAEAAATTQPKAQHLAKSFKVASYGLSIHKHIFMLSIKQKLRLNARGGRSYIAIYTYTL